MKRTVFIFLVLLVVLGLVGWIYFDKDGGKETVNTNSGQENIPGRSENWQEVDKNISVPEAGAKTPENIASPVVVGPGGSNTDSSFREFRITVRNNSFEPENIIVKKGDTVRILFNAVDAKYEFYQPEYGFKTALPVGETTVQFQATAVGKFRFYCALCGGPEKGPVGYLNVIEK